MPPRRRSCSRPLLLLLAVLGTAFPAAAQLKLPRAPREPRPPSGDLVPYLVCATCSARNYSHATSGRTDAEGRPLAWCEACGRDTPQSYPNAAPGGIGIPLSAQRGGDLKLPRKPRTAPPAQPAPVAPPPAPAPEPTPDALAPAAEPASAPGAPAVLAPAAARVLADVARLTSPDSGPAQRAVEALLGLGEDGLAAARGALFEDRAATIVVAARALLRGGTPADADLVVRRLRGRLPGSAGAPLLQTLVAEDPIRATDELFAALLDHPQPALRSAAARELRARLGDGSLELLLPALSSARAETRVLALELTAAVPGERATAALLERLADPNPRAAAAAVAALRLRPDADLDRELLARAFRDRWVLRPGAYALLAIMDREDAGLRPILAEEHVEPLLASLGSNDPFQAGACAAALAGIGFRSVRADVATWLDGPVVDRLVMAVSGKVFHDDHSSLVGPAVRRLRLLSGESIAQDGGAWVDWWVGAREGFRARRAALVIPPGDEAFLRLTATAPEAGLDVELVGPSAAPRRAGSRETIRLSAAQAAELSAALAREGVLSAARMPGDYGAGGRDDRTVTLEIRDRTKSFTAGARMREPWFEKLVSLAQSLRHENRWQLLVAPDPAAFAAEADWWAETHDAAQRAQRLTELALAHLRGPHSAGREAAIRELEAQAKALSSEAFGDLVGALRREPAPGERARRITALAVAAGRAESGLLAPPEAQVLLGAAVETFGPGASDLSAPILVASQREFVRRLAADESPLLRRAAAEALGTAPDADDTGALLRLLADPDARVMTAAAESLGAARVEAARDDLLARARLGEPSRRAIALRAAGALGGPHVLDALLLGLAEADVVVRRAAVEGLGRLGDPAAAQILVNVLSDAGDAPIADAARAALIRVGPAAVPALARAAEGGTPRVRRESALVLAQLVAPEAVPPLLELVSQDQRDAAAANELAVLSCLDPRGGATATAPAEAWWNWWEGVRHDDALVWFRAGVERLGIPQPREGALEGAGTAEGRRFLLTLVEREETWLAERAWREYRRLEGRGAGELPPRGAQRAAWVRERLAALASAAPAGGTTR
ncbi:MAG: HEAT repeat domain-containing protein [Planctomycetes bacterium]|nr:HEAT repeat domain-containing protein [Planctomycetota bacterium]